jgi:hypothetical protein
MKSLLLSPVRGVLRAGGYNCLPITAEERQVEAQEIDSVNKYDTTGRPAARGLRR